MPIEEERTKQRQARAVIKTKRDIKGPYKTVKQARNAFVYGGMRKEGWKPNQPRSSHA